TVPGIHIEEEIEYGGLSILSRNRSVASQILAAERVVSLSSQCAPMGGPRSPVSEYDLAGFVELNSNLFRPSLMAIEKQHRMLTRLGRVRGSWRGQQANDCSNSDKTD